MEKQNKELDLLIQNNIETWNDDNIDRFLELRQKDLRYTSFDYCYNHFYKMKKIVDLERSCAVLWSYLSSWGMLRGGAPLLNRNYYFLIPLVKYVVTCANKNEHYWEIDFPYEKNKDINSLIDIYKNIEDILTKHPHPCSSGGFTPSKTLITKIMLGIFASVPAFDRYVSTFFNMFSKTQGKHLKNRKVNKNSCKILNSIKEINRFPDLDVLIQEKEIKTITFDCTNGKSLPYTKAKLIDMYCFKTGELIDKNRKADKKNKTSDLAE